MACIESPVMEVEESHELHVDDSVFIAEVNCTDEPLGLRGLVDRVSRIREPTSKKNAKDILEGLLQGESLLFFTRAKFREAANSESVPDMERPEGVAVGLEEIEGFLKAVIIDHGRTAL